MKPAAALVSLALLLAGCGPSAPSLPVGPLTIGLITSLTGIDLGLGVDVHLGAQQAVDEVNSAGGVDGHQVRLAVVDDRSAVPGATDGYAALQKQKVAGLIGPLQSGSMDVVVAATAKRRTPVLSTLGLDSAARASNVFLAAPAAGRSADAMLAYAKKAGWTSVAIAHPKNGDAYADEGVQEFEAAALRAKILVGTDQAFDPATVDFTSQIAAVRGAGAQALLVWGGGSGPPILERMWAASGLGIPILLSPESATTAFLRAVADASEGALIETTQSVLAPTRKEVARMGAAFFKANGYEPTQAAFDGYGAARLLLKAIGDAGSVDAAAVDGALAHLSLSTASGPYAFSPADHRGLPSSWLVVAKVSGGKLGPAT